MVSKDPLPEYTRYGLKAPASTNKGNGNMYVVPEDSEYVGTEVFSPNSD